MLDAQVKEKFQKFEQQRQSALDYVRKQTELAMYMNDLENSAANYERQLGKSLTTEEFEKRLLKLSPNFRFVRHISKPDKKWLYFGNEFVSTYENGLIPEHSVRAYKEEEVWDMDFVKTKVVGGIPVSHIDKKDIPKSEYVPGKGLVFEGDVAPGFKKVNVPWHEALRGWRTVLIYIVGKLLATPTQVERIFGADNTPEWKGHLGKGLIVTPW